MGGFLFLGLNFLVVDTSLLCRKFIKRLVEGETIWPQEKLLQESYDRRVREDLLPDVLDIKLVAENTRVIGRLVFYPFAVLVLMILARYSYFDRWDWPLSIVLIVVLNSLFALMSVYAMRNAAEQAKRAAVERLKTKLLHVQGQEDKRAESQLRVMIDEVLANRVGAFAPLTQHPILGAVLMPVGGVGILVLLERLAGAF
jgi:hypothetical protein